MTTITIKILKTNGHSAAGKLADAEIHFTGGELDGLKLVGFAVWQRRDGKGQNVSFPPASSPCKAIDAASRCCGGSLIREPRTRSAIWCCRSFVPQINRSCERHLLIACVPGVLRGCPACADTHWRLS